VWFISRSFAADSAFHFASLLICSFLRLLFLPFLSFSIFAFKHLGAYLPISVLGALCPSTFFLFSATGALAALHFQEVIPGWCGPGGSGGCILF
jgi:hypothetical protein